MGLRSLFQRSAAGTRGSCVEAAAPGPAAPMSPELLEELRCAWDELTEASKHSKVTSFQACTRNGLGRKTRRRSEP